MGNCGCGDNTHKHEIDEKQDCCGSNESHEHSGYCSSDSADATNSLESVNIHNEGDIPNPILVNVTRGGVVESFHRGAIAIVNVKGEVELALGDINKPIYPRSAVKIIQALPMVLAGGVEKYNLTAEEISVTCASHGGEERHANVVAGMLEKAGLSVDDLECGAHRPTTTSANEDLIHSGTPFSALHNNCSGKHTAMLMLAKLQGFETKGYTDPTHPVQQMITGTFEYMMECSLDGVPFDRDGCSAPIWAMPLVNTAFAFAKISDPDATLPADTAKAVTILRDSVIKEPFMVGGTNRCCTRIMEVLKNKAFVKYGAEAVYTASLPEYGLGIAIKIDDGGGRAVEVALLRILEEIGILTDEDKAELAEFYKKPITNWNKFHVGDIEPAF